MASTKFNVGNAIRSPGHLDPATLDRESYVLPQTDGLDLLWSQSYLHGQMQKIEEEIQAIEANGNLSDTERMFAMQIAMNSWSAISNLRTNMLKSVSDTLKTIVRNIA